MSSVQKRRPMASRGTFVLALLVAFVAATGAKPFAPGISYRIRMVTSMPQMPGMNGGDMVMSGHGVAIGTRSRLDIDTAQAAGASPFGPGDYILSLDSGRVVMVSPSTRTYIDGFSMMAAAMPPEMMSMASITNVSVNVEKLGAGDPLEGRPTQRFRMTAQYVLNIMGQTLNTVNESEITTADLGVTLNTPFSGALPKSMSTGPFADLFARMMEAQKQVTGTAVKMLTTTSMTGPMSITLSQTMQISDVKTMDVDPKMLQIPDGFVAKP